MTEVLTTSETSKLPPEVATLLDPAISLPADAVYFEEKFDFSGILRRLLISGVLGVLSIFLIPLGVAMMFEHHTTTVYSRVIYVPLVIGLVFAVSTWMMLASVTACFKLRERQQRGQCTRKGIYLMPTCLVQAGDSDTIVIPTAQFRGVDKHSVKYFQNQVVKSFNLPVTVVNATRADLEHAIGAWAAKIPQAG